MNKKFFHPGSYPNIKRRWMAEQRALAKEKKEQEMKEQYEKEQQTYQHKMLMAKKDEDKIKLGLNFMYDLPPGMKKDDQQDNNEGEEGKEVKFEWQKNAPRAKYANKLGLDVHDQPFGVCVRNVKCFKCGKWGHQNVDKECPMYDKNTSESKSALDSLLLSDPLRLISDMKREHGLTLRKSVIGREIDPMAENQQILDSDDDENSEDEIAYIESLTDKQKKKLLKKLEKMEKKKNKEEKRRKEEEKCNMKERESLSTRSKRPRQEENFDDDEWEERAPEQAEHHRPSKRKRNENKYSQDDTDRVLEKRSLERTEQHRSRKRNRADKNRDELACTDTTLEESKHYKNKTDKHKRHDKIKRKKMYS